MPTDTETRDMIIKIHAALYGVEQQGGLMHKIELMEEKIDDLQKFKWQVLGGGFLLGALSGFLIKH